MMTAKQKSVLIARQRQFLSRRFIGNDIHRLVRVTANNRPVLGDRSLDCSTLTTRARHRRDGPGLEIGPQIAPGPKRPIQSADRSPAMWVAPIPTRERSSKVRMKPISVPQNRTNALHSNMERS